MFFEDSDSALQMFISHLTRKTPFDLTILDLTAEKSNGEIDHALKSKSEK